jgi:hypothetical protein
VCTVAFAPAVAGVTPCDETADCDPGGAGVGETCGMGTCDVAFAPAAVGAVCDATADCDPAGIGTGEVCAPGRCAIAFAPALPGVTPCLTLADCDPAGVGIGEICNQGYHGAPPVPPSDIACGDTVAPAVGTVTFYLAGFNAPVFAGACAGPAPPFVLKGAPLAIREANWNPAFPAADCYRIDDDAFVGGPFIPTIPFGVGCP